MTPAEHWLFRHSATQWMAAATNELALATAAYPRRRSALTHGRRGAGMALNAVLRLNAQRSVAQGIEDIEDIEGSWGRSYMDHLRAVADQAPLLGLPAPARELCARLVKTPIVAQSAARPLVQLRAAAGDDVLQGALQGAHELLAMCGLLVHPA